MRQLPNMRAPPLNNHHFGSTWVIMTIWNIRLHVPGSANRAYPTELEINANSKGKRGKYSMNVSFVNSESQLLHNQNVRVTSKLLPIFTYSPSCPHRRATHALPRQEIWEESPAKPARWPQVAVGREIFYTHVLLFLPTHLTSLSYSLATPHALTLPGFLILEVIADACSVAVHGP